MPQIHTHNLPGKLRCFILNSRSHAPIAGVPLRFYLSFLNDKGVATLIPGPTLASDHVGYVSFEITRGIPSVKNYTALNHIWVDPFLDETNRIDILEFGGSNYIPQPIALSIDIPDEFNPSSGVPSVLCPDVDDWRISPQSFGSLALPSLGEDGCESLFPSSATEHSFKFHQLVRSPALQPEEIPHISNFGTEFTDDRNPPLLARRGAIRHYEMHWNPLCHGLGEVLYSLTLAPCESVNLAVLDWTRDQSAERSEETGIDERLLHDQRRDRVIEEAVEATLQEWQSGDSFMGGTAGTGGYGGGGFGQMWGVTGSHSLGYGTASSEGTRKAEANTVQQLSDRVQQSTSMIRQLRSTVITQSTQAERERFETRTVTNHNHCHALTVLFYEVVRHYLVSTKFLGEQEVLFIKYPLLNFSQNNILLYQKILKSGLLDNRFRNAFDFLNEPIEEELNELSILKDGFISKIIVRVTMGNDSLSAPERLRLLILKNDGEIRWQGFNEANSDHTSSDQLFFQSDPNSPTINTLIFTLDSLPDDSGLNKLKLTDINELGLTFDVQGDLGGQERFEFSQMEVKAVISHENSSEQNNNEEETVAEVFRLVNILLANDIPFFMNDTEWWAAPNQRPDIEALYAEQLDKKRRLDELIEHLNDQVHNLHYNTLLWLNENPSERARRFENYALQLDIDSDGALEQGRLIEFLENTPLGVFGDYVAFPTGVFKEYEPREDEQLTLYERVLSVPTRGAFAETKLSHCNACEEIDETRFWDWQESPCAEAPAITGISPQSRVGVPQATSSNLPSSSIQVEGVEVAPSPVGLSEVFELLRTPEIFRDLSTVSELRPLLEKLVEVAGEVEKARISQLDASYEPSSSEGNNRQRNNNTSSNQNLQLPRSSSRETRGQSQILNKAIHRALDSGLIDNEQAKTLTHKNLSRLITGTQNSDDSVIEDRGIQQLIQRAATGDESRIKINRGEESFEYDNFSNALRQNDSDFRLVNWWEETSPASFDEIEFCIPFQTDYSDFRRAVAGAEEIRTRMIYRSNREYPEEVIDRRPDLHDIHSGYIRMGIEPGDMVCLLGYIVRDARRHVLLIRFATRDVYLFPDEQIIGRPDTEEIVEDSIQHARRIAEDIPQENPRQRVLCVLSLAERLGPTGALELFTLNPQHVATFIDMSEFDKERELRRGIPPDNYKVYPIGIIASLIYFQESYRNNDARFREALIEIDRGVYQTLSLFQRALASGSDLYGENFYRLRDWLRIQQESPSSIYSCYR